MKKTLVEHLEGARAGTVQVFSTERIRFGRHPDCEVVFDPYQDTKASARHAEMEIHGEKAWIRDLQSRNGTYLNGLCVTSRAPVKDGDEIQFGYLGPKIRIRKVDDLSTGAMAAGQREVPFSPGRTTAFRAILVKMSEESSRKLRLALILMVLVAVVSLAIISYMALLLTRRGDDASRWIVGRYSSAIFLLIHRSPQRSKAGQREATYKEHGFCTAFSIREDGLLATNAHCIAWMDSHRGPGSQFLARMNLRPEQSYLVVQSLPHPGFSSATSPDVGLIKLSLGKGRTMPTILPLAGRSDLLALGPGETIYTMGFPGQVINTQRPSASFYKATISRLTDFNNAPSAPQDNMLIWHDLSTSKGTSGSPIFNQRGLVVAINNGGLGQGLNFGVRVDLLWGLLAMHPEL